MLQKYWERFVALHKAKQFHFFRVDKPKVRPAHFVTNDQGEDAYLKGTHPQKPLYDVITLAAF